MQPLVELYLLMNVRNKRWHEQGSVWFISNQCDCMVLNLNLNYSNSVKTIQSLNFKLFNQKLSDKNVTGLISESAIIFSVAEYLERTYL